MAGSLPGGGTIGSVHDMTTFANAMSDSMGRVCVFCHVPHHANVQAGMLWSKPTNEEVKSGLKPYTWTAPQNMTIKQDLDPLVGPSRLCMSCHDGATAIDVHGTAMPAQGVISTNLNFMHPIGFSYDDAMAARGANELAEKTEHYASSLIISETPGRYNEVIRDSPLPIEATLYLGSVLTCVTCHDVHNKHNVSPDAGHEYNYLLWAKEEKSLICLTCHKK